MRAFLAAAVLATLIGDPSFAAEPSTPKQSSTTNDPVVLAWQREFGPTHDQRMKWWREARFGMFIHWGVYSVPAGVYKGDQSKHIGEWLMRDYNIPVAEYAAYAKQFNPVKFNADEWVRLAKNAGMKYIVITSKHHDGFAMFHSKTSDYNIYDATPFKRDPLKELAAACKKHGMKLGFYYSQAQDWHHPGGAAANRNSDRNIDKENHWDSAQQGSMDDYIDKIAVPQVKEILSNYGRLAVLWWDTPVGMTSERAEKFLPLLRLQPNLVTNNRLDRAKKTGDCETPEQKIPETGIPGKDWETCMTMNHTWGYKSFDHDWKSTETLLRNLIDIASKGGNYLLNVGPTSEGMIPEPSVERLKEIGAWMKMNSEAISGTTASPFQHLPWGRCTKKISGKEATLYLHVFNWPSDGKLLVPGLKNSVETAFLLSEPTRKPLVIRLRSPKGTDDFLLVERRKALPTESSAEGVVIAVPVAAPDRISSTVVLKIKGALEVN